MLKSRQRLGDDPRDHDGSFQGIDDKLADVTGVRPDADYSTNSPPASSFTPWRIYPKPPPPHWHYKDDERVSRSDGHGGTEEFSFSECHIPNTHPYVYAIDDKGVFQVYESAAHC
jgi:AMP deaminase